MRNQKSNHGSFVRGEISTTSEGLIEISGYAPWLIDKVTDVVQFCPKVDLSEFAEGP